MSQGEDLDVFRLLIICGSLRKKSSSAALTRALAARLAGRMSVEIGDIASLPHYNADLERTPEVVRLIEQIGAADGVLFVTPEYNYSIPGVLKNAIDWASRPSYTSVFRDKPAFVVSVSGGALGGVRAQAHLKYVLNGMLARLFPWQEAAVPHANAKVEDGRFSDDDVLTFVLTALEAFERWAGAGWPELKNSEVG
jgi:chromate reductase, NAD(P)H dehydrogenase (quinone)